MVSPRRNSQLPLRPRNETTSPRWLETLDGKAECNHLVRSPSYLRSASKTLTPIENYSLICPAGVNSYFFFFGLRHDAMEQEETECFLTQ